MEYGDDEGDAQLRTNWRFVFLDSSELLEDSRTEKGAALIKLWQQLQNRSRLRARQRSRVFRRFNIRILSWQNHVSPRAYCRTTVRTAPNTAAILPISGGVTKRLSSAQRLVSVAMRSSTLQEFAAAYCRDAGNVGQ